MVEKKWYVCTYDVWHRGETGPSEHENIKEAEEAAREYLRSDLEDAAADLAWEATVKCREATPGEIALEKAFKITLETGEEHRTRELFEKAAQERREIEKR